MLCFKSGDLMVDIKAYSEKENPSPHNKSRTYRCIPIASSELGD